MTTQRTLTCTLLMLLALKKTSLPAVASCSICSSQRRSLSLKTQSAHQHYLPQGELSLRSLDQQFYDEENYWRRLAKSMDASMSYPNAPNLNFWTSLYISERRLHFSLRTDSIRCGFADGWHGENTRFDACPHLR